MTNRTGSPKRAGGRTTTLGLPGKDPITCFVGGGRSCDGMKNVHGGQASHPGYDAVQRSRHYKRSDHAYPRQKHPNRPDGKARPHEYCHNALSIISDTNLAIVQ